MENVAQLLMLIFKYPLKGYEFPLKLISAIALAQECLYLGNACSTEVKLIIFKG